MAYDIQNRYKETTKSFEVVRHIYNNIHVSSMLNTYERTKDILGAQ